MIINTTPHDITIYDYYGKYIIAVYPKAENPLRLKESQRIIYEIDSIPVYRKEFEKSELPERKFNVYYIVSLVVAQTFSSRDDFLIVNETIRNEKGQIIGCKSFAKVK